ncbi:TPA: DUF5058 family protein [Clostridioides difficile]
MDYLKLANHPLLWIASTVAVSIVVVQSLIFAIKSCKVGKTMGITDKQIKSAVKSSAISAIGPSMTIFAGMVSLIVTMGGPIAWMRLSFIGSVIFESMSAGFGTDALGITLGSPEMTKLAFTNAVWTMILGSLGWIIFTLLVGHKLDKITNVISSGKKSFIPIISLGAMLGSFAYLNADRVLRFDNGTIACISGMAIMVILCMLEKKKNIKWLREWGLTISMFSGMIIASVI